MMVSAVQNEPPASPVTEKTPRVSVIVPVRNEEAHIAGVLGHLLKQDRNGVEVEILVADGQSTDRTREIVQELAARHPEIRLLENPGRLSSAARNRCIAVARGDFIVIVDGHCEVRSRTFFSDLVAAFARTGADCLGRPQPLEIAGANRLQRVIAAARSSPLGHHPASFIYSAHEQQVPAISVATAYRREVFERVGTFDPAFDACEDCELNHRIDRAGLQCWFVPQLAVHYKPRTTLAGLFRQMVRYGRGRLRMARKHPSSLSIATFLPALFLAGVVTGPLLCWWMPALWSVYVGALLVYLLIMLFFSVRIAAAARDIGLLFLLPPVFATIHLGSGWGVWRELVARR